MDKLVIKIFLTNKLKYAVKALQIRDYLCSFKALQTFIER